MKRMIILGVTLIATVVAITLGSIFYVSKNVKKSIEYSGGQEYVVKIDAHGKHSTQLGAEVAQSIYERIDSLGVGGAQVESGESGGHSTVRVRYPGLTSQAQQDAMKGLILEKPHLVFTDVFGNALFNNRSKFDLPTGTTGPVPGHQNYKKSNVPLASGGAKSIFASGTHKVEIALRDNDAVNEWRRATKYISKLGKGKNSIVAWLDISEFQKQMALWPGLVKGNPFLDAYVNNDPSGSLRKSTVDAGQFLISVASVKNALSGKTFVLEGNFNQQQTKDLARKLNYGSADYKLKLLSSRHIGATYGESAFKKAIIAGVIVFAIIAIFLILNYGLLGALSTISIALYIFMTLFMFTVMRGEYSPATIAAIIIGVGMSVDANIITFERLKNQLYGGASVRKANKQANKQSLSAIFDANITTLIIAFVLFYFGTRDIVGMSITLILSIAFTLIIMLVFTRILATLMLNTGYFDKRKHLLGLHPKIDNKIQKVFDKPDYIKTSSLFVVLSAWIIGVAVIVFVTLIAVYGSVLNGMNFSKEFTGGSDISISYKSISGVVGPLPVNNLAHVKSVLGQHGILGDAKFILDANGHTTSVVVDTTKQISLTDISNDFKNGGSGLVISSNYISNETAKKIVTDAMIAISIAIGLIIIYTLIRFKWTYSFAAIIALIHDGLMVVAVFTLIRAEISPIFIAGILSILGYSINDTIVTFDRVRERMAAHVGPLTAKNIKAIGNQAVKDTIKRSIFTSLTTITAILVLMSFGNATKMSFNVAMLVGLLAGTYSSIFIATFLWSKFEIRSQKGIVKREKTGFWKTKGIEEQTFPGINDYKS